MKKEDLLILRKQRKKKKPTFLKQDAHKKKKLEQNWRKPKGSDSKMRVGFKGYRRSVQIGWSSPSEVRSLNKEGKKDVMISNINQLEKVNKATDSVLLSASVGNKNKIIILEKAKELGLSVSNIKDVDSFLKKTKEEFSKRTDTKKKKVKERDEKKKKLEEKAKAKEKKDEKKGKDIESTIDEEEKKKEEKKELDRLLTRKE